MQIHQKVSSSQGQLVETTNQQLLPSSPSPASEIQVADVIIIGAGAAGIGAAKTLQKYLPEQKVILLEARDRIGGRCHSWKVTGISTTAIGELGANFLHGIYGNPIIETALKENINLKLFTPKGGKHMDSTTGKVANANLEAEVGALYSSVINLAVKSTKKSKVDKSVKAAMDEIFNTNELFLQTKNRIISKYGESQFKRYWRAREQGLENYYALELDRMSVIGTFDDEEQSLKGGNHLTAIGYEPLMNKFTESLTVLKNHVVEAVNYQSPVEYQSKKYQASVNVKVVHAINQTVIKRITFHCNYVISTLPLGCLKKSTVQFTPPLSTKRQRAIQSITSGVMNKVSILFDKVYWPENVTFLDCIPRYSHLTSGDPAAVINHDEDPVDFFLAMNNHFKGHPLLVGFTICDTAKSLELKSDEETLSLAVDQLQRMLGLNSSRLSRSSIKDYRITRWNSDQFSYGSYSTLSTGNFGELFDQMAEVDNDVLFFAGEHCCRKNPGTVHGAWFSGESAALSISHLTKQ